MGNSHIANYLAVSLGMASFVGSADAAVNHVFDIQPRAIQLHVCETNQLSLTSIHQMIAQRNSRDMLIIRSSSDGMLHL